MEKCSLSLKVIVQLVCIAISFIALNAQISDFNVQGDWAGNDANGNAPVGEMIVMNTDNGASMNFTPSGTDGTQDFASTGLTSDGVMGIDVTAAFSMTTSCTNKLVEAYSAPDDCTPLSSYSLTILAVNQSNCEDNGTGANTTDDFFTVGLSANAMDPVGTGCEVVIGAINGSGGTVIGSINYGDSITVGSSNMGDTDFLAAEGGSIYAIPVGNDMDPSCFDEFTTEVRNSSSSTVCQVSIDRLDVSGCYYSNNQSLSTVSVEVSWDNAPNNGVITVELGAATRTITPGVVNVSFDDGSSSTQTIVSPQVVTFEIAADNTPGTVTADFNGTCQDTENFTAPEPCAPIVCDGTNTGGHVFKDFNADGVQDNGETEGLAGITVTATTCDGTTVSTVTDHFGAFLLRLSMEEYPVRVEFTDLHESLGQGTQNGTNNGTTVQFVDGPTCNVDLGVLDPAEFCQTDPLITLPCYLTGALDHPDVENRDALLAFDYNQSGLKQPGQMTTLATVGEVGALWGVSYNKQAEKIFSSAVLKRHAGLTAAGLGAIFVTDMANYPTVSTNLFVDVVANLGIDVGSVGTNVSRGIVGTPGTPSNDNPGFVNAGRLGIGDIDMSSDGNTLFLTNLKDKKLYSIDISAYVLDGSTLPTSVDVQSYTLPVLCGSSGEVRPWAVKFFNNKVYVGAVCDASISQSKSDLRAFVVEFDPDNGFSSSIVLEFPLSYPKGFSLFSFRDVTGWFPWSYDWATKVAGNNFGGGSSPFDVLHPEPILADIEFDIDGSIIIGLNDLTGLQSGVTNYAPIGTSALYDGFVAGDILRGYFSNGVFIIENNAKAGPSVGYGPNNNQGPGFGEFYNDNSLVPLADPPFLAHVENVMGGLALRPGSGEVLAAVLDPIDLVGDENIYFFSGGLRHWSNTTGQTESAYQVYATNSSDPGTFSKATGLGDMEVGCDLPTFLEIGNYVWIDADNDGIQDACEDPLPGLTVKMYTKPQSGDPVLVATTTTDNDGEYYFSFDGAPGQTWESGFSGLDPDTEYNIAFCGDANNGSSLSFNGIEYSITAEGTGEGATALIQDMNDSDISLVTLGSLGDFPTICITTGSAGSVNHTYDAGFSQGACNVIINVVDVGLCDENNFDLMVKVNWENAPVGNLEFSTDDGLTYTPIIRTNMDANATDVALDLANLICNATKTFIIRFANAPNCMTEGLFVFPPTDPAGYVYCRETGEILAGGNVSVTPPAGGGFAYVMDPVTGDDLDGSSGRYSWIATSTGGMPIQEGRYTMSFTPPVGTTAVGTPGGFENDTDAVLDPTPGSEDNPNNIMPPTILTIGSDVNAGETALLDFSEGANPFFLEFDLAQDDPFVDFNNLAVSCCDEPTVAAFAIQASCTGGVVDANTAYLQISAATNATHFNWSVGSTYTGDTAITNATAFDPMTDLPLDSIGFGMIANPSGAQDYTLRIFNGVSGCYLDTTITLQEQDCTLGCDCEEYIYLNEPGANATLKFRVASDGSLTEIMNPNTGSHWASGLTTSPHGLGTDLNGYLYIGNITLGGSTPAPATRGVDRYDCDGNLIQADYIPPADGTGTEGVSGHATNMYSIGNTLYMNNWVRTGYPNAAMVFAYDLCTSDLLGSYQACSGGYTWDFVVDEGTNQIIMNNGDGIAIGDLDVNLDGPCIPISITDNTGRGIALDQFGNIYVRNTNELRKYNSIGGLEYSIDLLATGNAGANGWSLLYSRDKNLLFLAGNDADCIAVYDPEDGSYLRQGAPNNAGAATKAMGLLKECCPTNNNITIDTILCNNAISEVIFLQELISCDGTICEGTWQEGIDNSGLTYNDCNNSVTINSANACGTFTLESDGVGNNPQCGAFKITVNVTAESVMAPVIEGDQTIYCDQEPTAFTTVTPGTGSGTINYQWYLSNESDSTGFAIIPDSTNASFTPERSMLTTDTTYFRVITSVAGCAGSCVDTSNSVVVEILEDLCFDLALQKVINTTVSPGPFTPGDAVTFSVTVINQGGIAADTVSITDYVPDGLTFISLADGTTPTLLGNMIDVTDLGGGAFALDTLAVGDEIQVDLTFRINNNVRGGGSLINFAEITYTNNFIGLLDVDSTPDGTNGNDAGGTPNSGSDNETGGNGSGTPGGVNGLTDEDDHDPALLNIRPCSTPNCFGVNVQTNNNE